MSNQRAYEEQTQRIDVQQNLRTALAVLPADFRELDAVDGDINAMSATSIKIRAMRKLGIVCTMPVLGGVLTGRTMTVRSPQYSGMQGFTVGDSLLVYYEGDPRVRTDDSWLLGRVTAVAALACPDGSAGTQLTANLVVNGAATPPQVNSAGAVPVGAPVRSFETVTYQSNATGGRYFLEMVTAAGTQPLVGPLKGSTGLAFSYFTAAGATTNVPAQVAQVGISLRVESQTPVRRMGGNSYLSDSVYTRVTLRNNPRF
jgi:hypothetical protein